MLNSQILTDLLSTSTMLESEQGWAPFKLPYDWQRWVRLTSYHDRSGNRGKTSLIFFYKLLNNSLSEERNTQEMNSLCFISLNFYLSALDKSSTTKMYLTDVKKWIIDRVLIDLIDRAQVSWCEYGWLKNEIKLKLSY